MNDETRRAPESLPETIVPEQPRAKNRGGRPTSLTPELGDRIALLCENGMAVSWAAEVVGVSRQVVSRWLQQGSEQRTGRYRDFVDKITVAKAKCEAVLLATVQSAARGQTDGKGGIVRPGDWRAAMALLERLDPRRWAPRGHVTVRGKTKQEVTGKNGGPVRLKAEVVVADEDVAAQVEAKLAQLDAQIEALAASQQAAADAEERDRRRAEALARRQAEPVPDPEPADPDAENTRRLLAEIEEAGQQGRP